MAIPSRTLQLLQSQRKLSDEPLDSSPSMWSTTGKRRDPHKAHLAGRGGRHSGTLALYRFALSEIELVGFLQDVPHRGRVTLPPMVRLPPLRFLLHLLLRRQQYRRFRQDEIP